MYIKSVILVLATLLAYTYAIVLNPQVTSPAEKEVLTAGSKYTIKWDTEHVVGGPIPDYLTGTIKLGYLEGDDLNEHLFWELGKGFKLNQGSYEVTIPADLETRTRYIIVLMGNSGNASKEFTINGKGGSAGAKKRTIEKTNIKKKISLKKRMN
ncbi:unnamed protein product [Cunninghamella blakesleeana]